MRRLLLVLDNCEHVVEEVARIADGVIRTAPNVTILATSREALNVSGEHVYRMPSLAVPPAENRVTATEAMTYGAISLFVERANAADARFRLDDANANAVAEICRRLDGIALAIELAAPRIKVLSAQQLSQRLDERFRLLTGGSRAALPRQQTMRALIDWSYDLLSDNEKTIFRRVSIFAGGWTIDAASEVCADDTIESWDVLDILSTLVDKSLVASELHGSHQRYRLLESMRQYARERLTTSADAAAVARQSVRRANGRRSTRSAGSKSMRPRSTTSASHSPGRLRAETTSRSVLPWRRPSGASSTASQLTTKHCAGATRLFRVRRTFR